MFIEIPASKKSLSKRKPAFSVGVNDAIYSTNITIKMKRYVCPYYRKWLDMLRRCYANDSKTISPTYKDCSVCDEWLVFSSFKAWMIKQDWENKHLDKDILQQGNKIYSPKTCIFVTQRINNLFNDQKRKRGLLPIGATIHHGTKKYQAQCSDGNGKNKYLGLFCTPEKASEAYKEYKYKLIHTESKKQAEPLRTALLRWKIIN